MLTFRMRIKNGRDFRKTVYVQGLTSHDAIKTMKQIYGKEWIAYKIEPIYAK